MRTIGFNKPLYFLPFDHRGSFQSKMFGWHGALTADQTAQIAAAKQIIYDGFVAALEAGILVDEQFGAAILRSASDRGYSTSCPAEKSGHDEFDVEYGENFRNTLSFVPGLWSRPLRNYRTRAWSPTFGKSRDSIGIRIAKRW